MDKIKQLLKSKLAVGTIVAMMFILVCGIAYALTNKKEVLPILEQMEESYTFEYGEIISLEVEDYVVITDETVDHELIILDAEALVYVDDNEYVEVGTYDINVTYEEEMIDLTFVVEDTTAPIFVESVDTLETEEGTEIEDITSNFVAEDLSEVTITTEGEVDYDIAGEYTITVVASDAYENTTTLEVVITVTEKEEEQVADTTTSSSSGTTSSTSGTTSVSTSSSTGSSSSSSSSETTETTSGNTSSNLDNSSSDEETVVCQYTSGYWDEDKGYRTDATGATVWYWVRFYTTEAEARAWGDAMLEEGYGYWVGDSSYLYNGCSAWGVSLYETTK